jgi:hypothetical protein
MILPQNVNNAKIRSGNRKKLVVLILNFFSERIEEFIDHVVMLFHIDTVHFLLKKFSQETVHLIPFFLNRIFKLARHITGLQTMGMTLKNR